MDALHSEFFFAFFLLFGKGKKKIKKESMRKFPELRIQFSDALIQFELMHH